MIVFDTPTIKAGGNLSVVKTLAANTRSLSVTNYSHYYLKVESDRSSGYGMLPPFTTQTFTVVPSQQITFTCQSNNLAAQQLVDEAISYTESPIEFATGLQSLSIPVYAQSVVSLKLLVDPNSGFVPASASSQVKRFSNKISYFEFFNIDTQGRKVFINFNNPTTNGANGGDFQLLPDPNKMGQGAYYSCAANYDSFYYSGGDLQVMGWYTP